jgi:alkylation response protein AidB-like acyl-CoA dehydrogenase
VDCKSVRILPFSPVQVVSLSGRQIVYLCSASQEVSRDSMSLISRARTGCPPIYNYGSQELQDRVLPEIMSGRKRVCLAITEPEAGSDVKNLSTEAKLSEDGKYYIVNGVESPFASGRSSCA